jgi:hypothetical protein
MTAGDASDLRPDVSPFRRAAEALSDPAPVLFATLLAVGSPLVVTLDLLDVSPFAALPENPSTGGEPAADESGAPRPRADAKRAVGPRGRPDDAPRLPLRQERTRDGHSSRGAAPGSPTGAASSPAAGAGSTPVVRPGEVASEVDAPAHAAGSAAGTPFASGAGSRAPYGDVTSPDKPLHWTYLLERIWARMENGRAESPGARGAPDAYASRPAARRNGEFRTPEAAAREAGDPAPVAPGTTAGAGNPVPHSFPRALYAPHPAPPGWWAYPGADDDARVAASVGDGADEGPAGAARFPVADSSPTNRASGGGEDRVPEGELASIVNDALIEQARRHGVDLS